MSDKARNRLARGLLARVKPAQPSRPKAGKNLFTHGESSDLGPTARGEVRITAIPVDPETGKPVGKPEVLHEDKNLVVTQARDLMAAMAAGVANSALNYIELGDPSPAAAPALSDTNLQQTTGQRKASALVVTGNAVKATSLWLAGEGNGLTYTEAGLFTGPFGAGTMFARKSGFSIAKTASFQLQFEWTIIFDVQDATNSGCTGVALTGASDPEQRYIFIGAGGESQVVVPIDFVIGSYRLEFFLNGQRMVPTRQYNEAAIGANKGVNLIAFTLNLNDVCYFRYIRS